jgi:hypothetical protein
MPQPLQPCSFNIHYNYWMIKHLCQDLKTGNVSCTLSVIVCNKFEVSSTKHFIYSSIGTIQICFFMS